MGGEGRGWTLQEPGAPIKATWEPSARTQPKARPQRTRYHSSDSATFARSARCQRCLQLQEKVLLPTCRRFANFTPPRLLARQTLLRWPLLGMSWVRNAQQVAGPSPKQGPEEPVSARMALMHNAHHPEGQNFAPKPPPHASPASISASIWSSHLSDTPGSRRIFPLETSKALGECRYGVVKGNYGRCSH